MVDRSSSHQQLPSIPNDPDPNFIRWFRENCIPIAAVVLAGLLLCLTGHYTSQAIDWAKTKDFTDAFRNVVQALAFIAGGVWAYFRFVKERTFEERLTPAVTGRLASVDGLVFLIVTIQIKNVGLSKVTFNQKVSALTVFEYILGEIDNSVGVSPNRLTSLDVFEEEERSVEPNEAIDGQLLILIDNPIRIAYRLEFAILSNSGTQWRATTIVDRTSLTDNGGEQFPEISGGRNVDGARN